MSDNNNNKVKKTMGGISVDWNKEPLKVFDDFEVRIMEWSPKIRRMGYVVINRDTNVVELETTSFIEAVSFANQSAIMIKMLAEIGSLDNPELLDFQGSSDVLN